MASTASFAALVIRGWCGASGVCGASPLLQFADALRCTGELLRAECDGESLAPPSSAAPSPLASALACAVRSDAAADGSAAELGIDALTAAITELCFYLPRTGDADEVAASASLRAAAQELRDVVCCDVAFDTAATAVTAKIASFLGGSDGESVALATATFDRCLRLAAAQRRPLSRPLASLSTVRIPRLLAAARSAGVVAACKAASDHAGGGVDSTLLSRALARLAAGEAIAASLRGLVEAALLRCDDGGIAAVLALARDRFVEAGAEFCRGATEALLPALGASAAALHSAPDAAAATIAAAPAQALLSCAAEHAGCSSTTSPLPTRLLVLADALLAPLIAAAQSGRGGAATTPLKVALTLTLAGRALADCGCLAADAARALL